MMKGSYRVSSMSEDVGVQGAHVNTKGISWLLACVFIVANLAGGGMIAMPGAVMNLGHVTGFVLLLLTAIITVHTALQLSYIWTMMQNRWEKYRNTTCRKPYSEMAYRACGPGMRAFVGVLICVTSFGFATVLLLLASKNIMILLNFFLGWKINGCYLILIMGISIYPFSMLKSPRHFWQIAVFAAGSSSLAAILLIIGAAHDAPVCMQDVLHRRFDLHEAAMSYGTILFAYGGHSIFPTIIADMKKPVNFNKAIVLGFSLVTVLYLGVSFSTALVYGDSIGEIIIPSIQLGWVQHIVNVMIAIHVITTIIIVFSPLAQQVEDLFKISHSFGWQRFAIRTFLFWLVIFIALSLPHFGPMMDLIGASTMSLTSMILPSIFYLYIRTSCEKEARQQSKPHLSATGNKDEERATISEIIQYTPKSTLIFNGLTIAFGIIAGSIAMIASLIRLADTSVGVPCYVQYFRNGLSFHVDSGIVNCCGSFRNITVSGQDAIGYCAAYRT